MLILSLVWVTGCGDSHVQTLDIEAGGYKGWTCGKMSGRVTINAKFHGRFDDWYNMEVDKGAHSTDALWSSAHYTNSESHDISTELSTGGNDAELAVYWHCRNSITKCHIVIESWSVKDFGSDPLGWLTDEIKAAVGVTGGVVISICLMIAIRTIFWRMICQCLASNPRTNHETPLLTTQTSVQAEQSVSVLPSSVMVACATPIDTATPTMAMQHSTIQIDPPSCNPPSPTTTSFTFGPGPLGITCKDGAGGVFIKEVSAGTQAATINVPIGSLIVGLNGTSVVGLKHTELATKLKDLPRPVHLQLQSQVLLSSSQESEL